MAEMRRGSKASCLTMSKILDVWHFIRRVCLLLGYMCKLIQSHIVSAVIIPSPFYTWGSELQTGSETT